MICSNDTLAAVKSWRLNNFNACSNARMAAIAFGEGSGFGSKIALWTAAAALLSTRAGRPLFAVARLLSAAERVYFDFLAVAFLAIDFLGWVVLANGFAFLAVL